MNRGLWICLGLWGCGAASSVGLTVPVSITGDAVNDGGPGWAKTGDVSDDNGHRLVCLGQGNNEQEALQSAQALCEDKICKLCGVDVESVVQTSETLNGVEMRRTVVERCRRVRRQDLAYERKSVDCTDKGCFVWVRLNYTADQRRLECTRYSDESYADPGACQALIEQFKATQGHTASSFRLRVDILENALSACAEIDVRPTPLMQSLEEKLRIGMGTFRKGAPRHLRSYWLQDYSPMWEKFRQSPKFSERLDLLLGYLRHKVPLLDVIEAASVDAEQLDTPAAMVHLLMMLKAAPREQAYGVEDVHRFAVDVIERQADRQQLTVDVGPINRWIRGFYSPGDTHGWSRVVNLYGLFSADKKIDREEWQWATKMNRWRNRTLSELLKIEHHIGATRVQRFEQALQLALTEQPSDKRFAAFKSVLPRQEPQLLLEVEGLLPQDIRVQLDFDFFAAHLPRFDDPTPAQPTQRLLQRMHGQLASTKISGDADRGFCTGLYKDLELLEKHGIKTIDLEKPICGCLTGPMAMDPTLNSVNKSALYRRALAGEMRCVRPL